MSKKRRTRSKKILTSKRHFTEDQDPKPISVEIAEQVQTSDLTRSLMLALWLVIAQFALYLLLT